MHRRKEICLKSRGELGRLHSLAATYPADLFHPAQIGQPQCMKEFLGLQTIRTVLTKCLAFPI